MKTINLNDYIFEVRKYYAYRNTRFKRLYYSMKMKKDLQILEKQFTKNDLSYKEIADFLNFVKSLNFYRINLVGDYSTPYRIKFDFYSDEIRTDLEIAKISFNTYSIDTTLENIKVDYTISVSTNNSTIKVNALAYRTEKHNIFYDYEFKDSLKNYNNVPCIRNVSSYFYNIIMEFFRELYKQYFN